VAVLFRDRRVLDVRGACADALGFRPDGRRSASAPAPHAVRMGGRDSRRVDGTPRLGQLMRRDFGPYTPCTQALHLAQDATPPLL
jgi:hypothetical protein